MTSFSYWKRQFLHYLVEDKQHITFQEDGKRTRVIFRNRQNQLHNIEFPALIEFDEDGNIKYMSYYEHGEPINGLNYTIIPRLGVITKPQTVNYSNSTETFYMNDFVYTEVEYCPNTKEIKSTRTVDYRF